MTGYDSSDLSGMIEKVTAGATGALGNITMTGYDSSDLSGMVTKITSGATGALGNISMTGYDSDDLSGMVSKITSGATGALGDISMEGYSSDNVSAFTTTITNSVTSSLGNITMSGYNASTDNLTSYVTSGASSASLIFLGSDNVTGTFSTSWGGAKPSGGCVDNASALSAWSMPTGTAGYKHQYIFTSSTSFTDEYSFYSNDNCTTSTGFIKYNYKDVNVGSTVSLTALSPRPSSAYQVQYSKLNVKSKGSTTAALSYLNSELGTTHSSGVEQTNYVYAKVYNIWATGTSGGSTWLYIGPPGVSTYPTAWTSYDDVLFQ